MEDRFYIIGVDGGASKTRGILFTDEGDTIASIIDKGTNLSVNGEVASTRIHDIINNLCNAADIPIEYVDAIGLGLAGSSNQEGRDMVFGKLDNLKLSQRTIIMNDAEAAFILGCPGDFGILVTVGTGVICMSRNTDGKSIRQAGKGHDQGDMGSGYWIGRQALLNLTLNETSVLGDQDLEEIMSVFLTHVNDDDFQVALEKLNESDEAVFIIAGIAESIIGLAEKGNEVALSIIQEATHAVSEYIIALTDDLGYNESQIVLSGNGSVIRNDFFRNSLNEDLRFNFPNIKWIFSSISPAYGAGILAAKIYDVDVKVSDIIKGNTLAPA
jgi:N-acetylglucosamine kinase-like BadF-type ATPase|tara:strand:- start:3472 stop:4455 length:984 start_codon:yes stop_codon:yes gene_type:complete